MLTSVFDELTTNQDGIGQSLKDGLRTDKIVGTCQKCKSDLIIGAATVALVSSAAPAIRNAGLLCLFPGLER